MSASPCGSSAAGRAGVFIVDDHPVVRKGLALLINQEQDLYVCGEAEDAAAALAAIERNPPDIVLVDISLPGVTGIDLIRQIRARCPDMAILVLSMMDESMYAERALRAGARGYVMKQEATDRLISAIHGVLRGEYCLSGEMSSRLFRQVAAGKADPAGSLEACLSDRELEVFRRLGHGMSTRKIAADLHLSVKTIESHRENIKHKLGIRNATKLVQIAAQWVQRQELG